MPRLFDLSPYLWPDVSNDRQPQGLVKPSDDGIAEGLVAYIYPVYGHDIVRNKNIVLSSSTGKTTSEKGVIWTGAASNSSIDIGASGGIGSILDQTKAWSIAMRVYLDTVGIDQYIAADFDAGAANKAFTIATTASGGWLTEGFDTAGASGSLVYGGSPTVGYHDILVVFSGSSTFNVRLWIDGVLIGAGSNSTLAQHAGSGLRIASPGAFTAAFGLNGGVIYTAIWQGDKSDYVLQLKDNPWSLVQAANSQIYFAAGAPGNATASIASITLSTCTANAFGDALASGNLPSAISLSALTATSSGKALATATIAEITLSTISAVGSVFTPGTGFGAISSVILTAPTATASGAANALSSLVDISFTTISGVATGSAYSSGNISEVTLTNLTGTAHGAAIATGSVPVITATTVNGTAFGAGVGIGSFDFLALTTIEGTGIGGSSPIILATGSIPAISLSVVQANGFGAANANGSFYAVTLSIISGNASTDTYIPTTPKTTIKMDLQTDALVQMTLKIGGEILTFDTFAILGIPGFRIDRLYSSEVTNYAVEQQEWNIHCSSLDCRNNNIKDKDSFTLTDTTYRYTFKLNSNPIPYGNGWAKCRTNLLSKALL